MTDAFIYGVFMGLVLTVFVGPGFFILMQTSILKGMKAALFLEAGFVLSDLMCIVLSYFGIAQLLQRPEYKTIAGITGGLILILFGILSIVLKDKQPADKSLKINTTKGIQLIIKGFFFNSSVPSVIVFWIASVSLAVTQFNESKTKIIIYFTGIVLTYVLFDLLKIYGAAKTRKFFAGNRMIKIKKGIGIALILFGLIVIIRIFVSG